MINVYSFTVGTLQVNCYVITDKVTGDIAIGAIFKRTVKSYTINIVVDSSSTGYGTVSKSSVEAPYGSLVVFNENVLTMIKKI